MRYSLLAFVECTHDEQGLKPTTLTIIRVSICTPIPSLKWDAPLLKVPREAPRRLRSTPSRAAVLRISEMSCFIHHLSRSAGTTAVWQRGALPERRRSGRERLCRNDGGLAESGSAGTTVVWQRAALPERRRSGRERLCRNDGGLAESGTRDVAK